jgi:hypothetical protein
MTLRRCKFFKHCFFTLSSPKRQDAESRTPIKLEPLTGTYLPVKTGLWSRHPTLDGLVGVMLTVYGWRSRVPAEALTRGELEYVDPGHPLLICVRVVKLASDETGVS